MTPDIILGPPGTGKTTTLLNILDEELADGTTPGRIGYVSFTRKAADEAVQRACRRFNYKREEFPNFRTLHSLCFRVLGLRSNDILAGKKFFEFADWARIRVTGRGWSDDGLLTGFEEGDRILFMENLARIRGIPLRVQYDIDDDHLPWREVERVARALAEYKRAKGLLDYTDMLSEFVRQQISINLEVLLVDESQDLSALQWRVVERLASHCRRVVVAGDDDQAIYRWAGADVEHLIAMEGRASVLGQSWRCPPVIQEMSSEIISGVTNRRQKKWKPRRGGAGVLARVSEFDEADVTGDGSVLVLARNSYIIREQIEPILRAQGIVYEKSGKSSLDMDALAAAEYWTILQRGGNVSLDNARSMYVYLAQTTGRRRGYKDLKEFGVDPEVRVTIGDLVERGGLVMNPEVPWHAALERMPPEEISYMQAARRRGEKLRAEPRVRVSTIHSAKGGEGDHVVLMTEMAQRTYREMMDNPEDERRVWYVGVTRAKKQITVVGSETARFCPWV